MISGQCKNNNSKKLLTNKDGGQIKGILGLPNWNWRILQHPKHRALSLSPSSSPTQLLVHIKSLPASFQLKQPCRPGQQYATPHQITVSHSEHQAHCPVLTPPLTLTLHPLRVCVVLQTALCSLFLSSKYCLSWDCLERSFVLLNGGEEKQEVTFLNNHNWNAAGYRSLPSKITEETQDLNFHCEICEVTWQKGWNDNQFQNKLW